MPTKRYSTEQIVSKLRQAEVELSRGLRVPLVWKKLGISEQTYDRWRKEYGGLRLDQATRLKELERENTRLKQLVADQALDNAILKGGDLGKLLSPPRGTDAPICQDTHSGSVCDVSTSAEVCHDAAALVHNSIEG